MKIIDFLKTEKNSIFILTNGIWNEKYKIDSRLLKSDSVISFLNFFICEVSIDNICLDNKILMLKEKLFDYIEKQYI